MSWRFVHVADMQPGSPKSFRYLPALTENWQTAKRQIRDLHPELVLVGGDITRDGNVHRFELEEMKADLDDLGAPCHVVPGNMDTGNKHTRVNGLHRGRAHQYTDTDLNVTSGQLRQFGDVFGPPWWSVEHRGVRFSGFADVLVNSGLPEEGEFWQWAEKQMQRPKPALHVWIMHYALFVEQPDEPDWDIADRENYHNWYFSVDNPGRERLMALFRATGATVVISGHIHCRRTVHTDGIRFDYAPSVSFGQWAGRWPDGDTTLGFLLYTVDEGAITCEFVPLDQPSTRKDQYGVGGHPCPQVRDYSMAWDQSFARSLDGRIPDLADAGRESPHARTEYSARSA